MKSKINIKRISRHQLAALAVILIFLSMIITHYSSQQEAAPEAPSIKGIWAIDHQMFKQVRPAGEALPYHLDKVPFQLEIADDTYTARYGTKTFTTTYQTAQSGAAFCTIQLTKPDPLIGPTLNFVQSLDAKYTYTGVYFGEQLVPLKKLGSVP